MIADVIIIAVILLLAWIGKKRGMMRCLVNVASFVISMVLAFTLCKPLGEFLIKNTTWDESINEVVKNSIQIDDVQINMQSQLPDVIEKYIDSAADGINDTKNNIQEKISTEITTHIMYGISYIMVFILTKVIIIILNLLSKIMEKLPVIDKMNEWGGAILGLAQGIIAVYTIITLISIFAPMMEDTFLIKKINKSYIGAFIYNNNLFLG